MKKIIAILIFTFSSIIVNAQQIRGRVIVDAVSSIEIDKFSLPFRFIDLALRPLILKSLTDKSYIIQGQRLKNFKTLSPYLVNDLTYGLDVRRAVSIRNQTKVFAIMTGIVFVGSLTGVTALVYGVPILSIITLTAGARYIRKRTRVEELFLMSHLKIEHHKELDPVASLNLGMTQNGIGLVLNF